MPHFKVKKLHVVLVQNFTEDFICKVLFSIIFWNILKSSMIFLIVLENYGVEHSTTFLKNMEYFEILHSSLVFYWIFCEFE